MKLQKRLSARVLKCGSKRVRFDPGKLTEVKEAITKFDITRLVNRGVVYKVQAKGISTARAKKIKIQKRKGRKSGHGSRKGTAAARRNPKRTWIAGVRAHRDLIKRMRDKKLIDKKSFRTLYAKIKGGFFRSTSHVKIYVKEQDMIKRK